MTGKGAGEPPLTAELQVRPWVCPHCIGGLTTRWDGDAIVDCLHCGGVGLTDDPDGATVRAPRPPGVMRTACADCALRRGSPELEGAGAGLPEDGPFWCHQGLPISATGKYTPVALYRGQPLGAMVCAGWWALRTGEALPAKPYREIPITEADIDKRWGPKPGEDQPVNHKIHTFDEMFVCRTCGAPVTGWHQPSQCGRGCDQPARHEPDCGHLGVIPAPLALANTKGHTT